MSTLARAALLAVVQVGLIGAVAGKLFYDRAHLPRAWVETAGVDPDLPIRGRYVALNLVLPGAEEYPAYRDWASGRIEVRDGRPVAVLVSEGCDGSTVERGELCFEARVTDRRKAWLLDESVAFFLPEHAPDPTRGVRPGELWVEVTLPPGGSPRPVRLGLQRAGKIEPIG